MGGVKVVYQHAARFVAMGHAVTVVMPRRTDPSWRGRAREAAVQVRDRLHRIETSPYYQHPGVVTRIVPLATDDALPDADIVIATGVQTARWVRELAPQKGAKVYFIQHLEAHIQSDVRQTWAYPMAIVTCAQWLADEVRADGLDVLGVVPNAIDPTEFYLERPIGQRGPRVAALYHRHPIKGPDVLLAALERLRALLPDIEAEVFAARPPSHRFPAWVTVRIRPSVDALRALYNRTAVLLNASRSEGWGLVPMEAAACGAAVVSSANEGISEFLAPGESVALAPVGDSAALAEAAYDLLSNEDQRVRQAETGRAHVARFDLDAHSAQFAGLLQSLVAHEVEG